MKFIRYVTVDDGRNYITVHELNEKNSLILHGWESREQKHQRYMKMRTITCFGDRTSGTFFIIASVSRKKRKRIKKRKKSLVLHDWESRQQNIEEYENGNNNLLW